MTREGEGRAKRNTVLRETDIELRATAWWLSGTSRLDFPRSGRTFTATLGFIGSEETFRALRPECPLHLLTRANWRVSIEERLVDIVLIEPCLREVTDDWRDSVFDGNACSAEFRELLATARRIGVPTVCWLTSDVAYEDLHAPFAGLVDAVFCADHAFVERLADAGVSAAYLPQCIQPSIHSPFLDLADRDQPLPEVLFLGWTSVLADQELADALRPLVPVGLRIAEPKGRVRQHRTTSTPALQEAILGTVGLRDRLILLKGAKILIQAANDLVPRRTAEQAALEAAACQCVVLHHGPLDPRDARTRFAKTFERWSDLRAFVAQLQSDRVLCLRLAQLGWRVAQEEYCAAKALAAIFSRCGIAAEIPSLRASVVTPTIRPELLEKVLEQFRSQTWANKELVVVANTNDPSAWRRDLVDPSRGEQIVFLPREHWAGAALNTGARRTSGDYVFRMDDDDHYGANYLRDMMLHARSTDADVLGKQVEFLYSTLHDSIFWRPHRAFTPTVFSSQDFSYEKTPLGGFSMALKSAVAVELGYPELFFGFADSSFLAREKQIGKLTLALTDSMNAVVERRADLQSHTWRLENNWESKAYHQLSCRTEDLMV